MQRMWQILVIASIMMLGACEPKVAERGKLDLQENAAVITPYETTKAELQTLLGSPSAKSQFGAEQWYYIAARKEGVAFFAPDIVEQQVLKLSFEGDVVSDVKLYDKSAAKEIEFVDRETPTEGQEYTFIEQLIGNIGRFNKQSDSLGGK